MTDLSNWAPYEVIVGPADVYLAATNTAFPDVDAAPGAGWTYVGLTEGGITVRHTQTVTPITADQATAPVKALRTEEGLEIEFAFVNLTLENYAIALNNVTVDSAAGPPATKSIDLHRGTRLDLRALLVRGRSPYGNFPAQYQVPVVYQAENPEVTFVKDDKAVLQCNWTAFEDVSLNESERFGQLVAQTAS